MSRNEWGETGAVVALIDGLMFPGGEPHALVFASVADLSEWEAVNDDVSHWIANVVPMTSRTVVKKIASEVAV